MSEVYDFTKYYDIYKTVHIISIISWMVALFYLPRLFVYHSQHYNNIGFKEVVEVQEKKLYYYIAYPAMIATLISGSLITMSLPGIMKSGGWIHAKFTLVMFLIMYHFICGYFRKALLRSQCRSNKFFRVFNEIPTLLTVIIVSLVVIKPF